MKRYSLILCLLAPWLLSAQAYRTAGGIRIGTDRGITVQQKVFDQTTAELIIQSSLRREETNVTLLLERHKRLISKRFNFYYGVGLHKGWVTETESSYDNPSGITGIMGAEMTFGRLNLSWDYKPAINIKGGDRSFYSQSGISLRYVLVKKKKKKINLKFWEKWGKKK